MDANATTAKQLAAGGARASASAMSCSFAYEECDISPGITLNEWRRATHVPRRRSVWARVRRITGR
jgi:hypothetical protein